MRIIKWLVAGSAVVVIGWVAISLAVYAWTTREPNYDGLAHDISDLPGVVEATSTTITEDTEAWTSIVRVVVADDIDDDQLAAVIEEYEDDDASEESVRLAITVEGEPQTDEYGNTEGSVLLTRGEADSSADVRATGFLRARALADGDASLTEDALVMHADAELDEAVRTVAADPDLSALPYITVHGPIGEQSGGFQGPTPIEADALDALEATSSVMREMSPKVASTLHFTNGYVPPYGVHHRELGLRLAQSVKVAQHRSEVERTVRKLIAVGFEQGEPGAFRLGQETVSELAEVSFGSNQVEGEPSDSVRWQRFVETVVAQEIDWV